MWACLLATDQSRARSLSTFPSLALHQKYSHNPINKWVCLNSHKYYSRYLHTLILRYTSWLEWSAQPALVCIFIYIRIFTWAKCDACNRLSTLNRFSWWRKKMGMCMDNKVIYWFFGRLLIKFSRERERESKLWDILRIWNEIYGLMWSTD